MSIAEKLTIIAENQQRVYEAGKAAGGGGDSWYDTFWDAYQKDRASGDCQRMFSMPYWTSANFAPKYLMNPTNASSMFISADISGDFAELLESLRSRMFKVENGEVVRVGENDVLLDLSNCSSHGSMFNSAEEITRLPELNMPKGKFSYTFGGMTNMRKFDKLKISNNGNQEWSHAFDQCNKLEDIIIEGTIGQNGFNVQWSTKLTHDSLMSIINALADYSGDTSGTIWTVTIGAENIEKLTEEDIANAEAKGWEIG